MYVEHPPRYEHRFLKNALLRDPKVLAHVFLTSADEGFPQEHTKSDDPLFQAPLEEFPKELKSLLAFDVLIFGDVDPAKLGARTARNIEVFVKDFGGGILFISGMLNSPRCMSGTPIASLLPVVMTAPSSNEKLFDHTFGYALTAEGRSSPVTNFKEFEGNRERNRKHWEDGDGLPEIRWFHPVEKVRENATVLVQVKTGETRRSPLFVTQRIGHGRSFWSATDETWLWRRLVGDLPWFYPFWRQALQWAAGD